MNTNRLIKISLLLFMSMIAIWASDGNVTINDFENFKDEVSMRVASLEKNIDWFYGAAGVIVAFLTLLLGLNVYRNYEDSKTMDFRINEAKENLDAIHKINRKTKKDAQEVRDKRNEIDEILKEINETKKNISKTDSDIASLENNKPESKYLQKIKDKVIKIERDNIDAELTVDMTTDDYQEVQTLFDEASKNINYFIHFDWQRFLSQYEIDSVSKKFTNSNLLDYNRDVFINQVFKSFSLDTKEKLNVVNKFDTIDSSQYLGLIKTFIEEILEFQKLEESSSKDIYKLIYFTLKSWKGLVCELSKIKEEDMWHQQEVYLAKSIEMYLDDEQKYNVISVMFANDLYNQRKYSKSIKILEGLIGDSLYNDKVSIESHLLLSKAYVSVDDFQNALKVAENCIVVDIDINIKIEFYGLMLYVYIRQKMKMKANETAKELKKLKENHYELLEYMEYLITVNGFEDASKIFEKDTMEFDSGEKYRVVYYWLSYIVNICLNKEANIYEERFKEYLNELPNELDWNTKDIENWLKDAELSYKQKAMVDDTIKLIKDKNNEK